MNKNLLDFTRNLSYKVNNRKGISKLDVDDIEDAIQNTLIDIYEENITELEGNELRINHLITANINKLINKNKNNYKSKNKYFIENHLNDFEFAACNTPLLKELFDEFCKSNKLNENHLELFYLIKFENNKYSELGEDTATQRKNVSRIFSKFKNYLIKKKIKLIDFYEK